MPARVLLMTALAIQASAADPRMAAAADGLLALLRGAGAPQQLFSADFLAAVPPAQIAAIAAQLSAAHGRPLGVAAITPEGASGATVRFDYERATVDMRVMLDPAGRIGGLLVTGTAARVEDRAAILRQLRDLPGATALVAARLGDRAPHRLLGFDEDRALAIGSTFKLVILAELARAVEAGERRWDEVVAIRPADLPTGLISGWPDGSPMTLHSLAALMISRSDNAATDALLFALGRERVEAMQATLGLSTAARNTPFLSTAEAFKLKAVAGGALGDRYLAADTGGRRALLAGDVARTPLSAIDAALFAGPPLRIDRLEWFATPDDLVRTMDWLRRASARPTGAPIRGILGINPGIGPATAARYRWVGYKGGSEGGVISMTLLAERRDGSWVVLSSSWNNPEARVEDARFAALVEALAADLAGSD